MRKSATLLLFCLLSVATAARADHYSDTYVIPIAGHTTGPNDTLWMTDLAIRNFSGSPIDVEMLFIEAGDRTYDNVFPLVSDTVDGSVTVRGNETVFLRDVLKGYGSANVSGAILLGADRPFAVTSRTYNNRFALGQTVPATGDFLTQTLGNPDNSAYAYIPGISQTATRRTNVGFAAGAGTSGPMVVEITIRQAAGGIAGTRSYTVPAGTFEQMQFPVSSITDAVFDVGSVEVRIASGDGSVVPYASVVDGPTSEATFIMGQLPENDTTGVLSLRTNLFRALFGSRDR